MSEATTENYGIFYTTVSCKKEKVTLRIRRVKLAYVITAENLRHLGKEPKMMFGVRAVKDQRAAKAAKKADKAKRGSSLRTHALAVAMNSSLGKCRSHSMTSVIVEAVKRARTLGGAVNLHRVN